ncbi:MAG: alkaline phosphatase family protein [Clostridia bacterium]|nr:alkaline phosphatase family protein [Clostridia bacterium]
MKKPELFVFGLDGACPSYIKEAVREGRLPNFKRLMDCGVFLEDCMTAFPSITPTCWSAMSTGAPPSVNGALCYVAHETGTHPEEVYTPYSSKHIRAERFWEAAARIGKTALLIDVPCSGPAKCDGILQVRGNVSTTPDCAPEDSYASGIPQQFFRNDGASVVVNSEKKFAGGEWDDRFGQSDFLSLDENTFVFRPVFSSPKYNPNEVESHIWVVVREKDGVRVGIDEASARTAPLLRTGEWSEVITRRLMTEDGERIPFQFRARLDEFDEKSGIFTVFITGAENFLREITPRTLAKELAEIKETFCTDYSSIPKRPCSTDKYFDGERFAVSWNQQVVAHCLDRYEPDIVFDYYGNIDTVNHRFRSAYEGVRIRYEGEHECAVDAMRKNYDLVDEHLGWLLDHATDEHTTILLVSDHGSVGDNERVNPWEIMEKAGLMSYLDESETRMFRQSRVDWTKSRVYPVGSCYINVNLKGREPCGIVAPEDYDATVTEIITALQKYGRTADGSTVSLAFAVEKDQAGFIGHGGKNCGDVVYGLAGCTMGGAIGGVHSQQIPSARSKTGDIRSLCLFSGPNIRKNVSLSRPADLTDLAPTLCYAMGYPQPKDATGGIIFQIFEE